MEFEPLPHEEAGKQGKTFFEGNTHCIATGNGKDISHILWKMGRIIPYMKWKIKAMFETTNQFTISHMRTMVLVYDWAVM